MRRNSVHPDTARAMALLSVWAAAPASAESAPSPADVGADHVAHCCPMALQTGLPVSSAAAWGGV
jgi:hypothetical protein